MTVTSASSKPTMIVVTAIYTLINAIFSLCGALAVLGLGAIAGIGTAALNQAAQSGDADAQAAANAIGAAGGLATGLISIVGILVLVVAIALLVDAVGLFQVKPWAWMLTIVLYGISVVLTVLQWLLNGNNFNILSLVLLVINVAIIYLFYTNADIKSAFGKV